MVDAVVQYLIHPKWRRQHGWRKAIWDTFARLGLTGMHALPMNRRWVEIHRRNMTFPQIDPSLIGMRLIQLSDLHYSPVVWQRYLIQYLAWVNELKPDLIVITGDLITGGYRYAHRVATILSHLKAPHGVICTFGNHDYSIYGRSKPAEGKRRADYLAECLRDRGLRVLRNESMPIFHNGSAKPLMLVGLDDEWTENLDAPKAFAGVDGSAPVICLNHNPANCGELMDFPWQWMLSGHTHGRQVATSRFGRRFFPHRFRHYTHGYYAVNGRSLYVNRGLAYGQRTKDWCRPEITVFKIQPATPA